MKKQVIAFMLLLVIGAQMAHFGYIRAEAKVIPDEAIRLRILANSDSEEDQALKRKVRDRVKAQIDTWVADLHSIDDARRIIQSRIPQLEQTVAQVLKEEGSEQSYKVEFGKHIKFPTKLYGNFLYPAGEYEAVLVTLGKGEGANWWCVLFPPLCFLDFSSGTAVRNEEKTAKAKEVKEEEKPAETDIEKTEEVLSVDKKVVDKKETKKVKVKQTAEKAKEALRMAKEEKLIQDADADSKHTPAKESAKVEVKEVKEEEEVKVKFFLVDVISSLFSK
jgi:stage II sporulation protein R